ncbi:MAG TPA: methionine--tRNA ligase [Tissierellia bacterium]|nr:methionine--tRNA ligase [Tissierellia bacterium]
MKEKYYLSTAIAYTSKVPHIGNTYEAILADALVRYKRLRGYDVYFLTGTDEHGEKIQQEAIKNGRTPQEHVDIIAGEVQDIWDTMNVSYDQFIRTTDPKHKKVVQRMFEIFYEQDDIYKGVYQGHYCTRCESFYSESQLVDGKCPEDGSVVQEADEEAYFFRLSKYQKWLEQYIEEHPDFIYPESRKREMMNNFIKPGLRDLCVSRTSFDWGIPVTIDEGHVVYVWLDALSNYITALGFDPDGESDELFVKNWPADLHLIGKDIVRFHTIYWPIFLHALGLEIPKQVYGHPWVLTSGGKMSKSEGNVLYAKDLVKQYGLDRVRYALLRDMPFAEDGIFTHDTLITRTNQDLANILGNLLNRTLAMSQKYFGGVVEQGSELNELDRELIQSFEDGIAKYQAKMDVYHVGEAIREVIELAKKSNKYIDDTMPWVLAKDEDQHDRLKTVLYVLTENLRILSILLSPIMPDSMRELQRQLATDQTDYDTVLPWGQLTQPHKVSQPTPLFERLAENPAAEEKPAPKQAEPKPKEEPIKQEISFDDFAKLDLRVADVIAVEDHPNADKLYVLTLRVGSSERTVVSGIRDYYTKEELVGKKFVLIANLKPIKLRGIMSHGMLLAEEDEKHVRMIKATLASGSRLG